MPVPGRRVVTKSPSGRGGGGDLPRLPAALERRCTDHGIFLTRQRRIVLSLLAEAKRPIMAEELWLRALESGLRVALATVHRTLKLVSDAGIATWRALPDGRYTYAWIGS